MYFFTHRSQLIDQLIGPFSFVDCIFEERNRTEILKQPYQIIQIFFVIPTCSKQCPDIFIIAVECQPDTCIAIALRNAELLPEQLPLPVVLGIEK